jgi:hypothetical protein
VDCLTTLGENSDNLVRRSVLPTGIQPNSIARGKTYTALCSADYWVDAPQVILFKWHSSTRKV